jgi:thiol-disulfide isomerase/thioredoxin
MCTNIGKEINFNIDLYQPDQKNYTSKDITEDFYILNFWFPSCAPCAKELPHFEKLYKEYQDNVEIIGIQMIGIDDIDEGIKFSKKLNLSFKL